MFKPVALLTLFLATNSIKINDTIYLGHISIILFMGILLIQYQKKRFIQIAPLLTALAFQIVILSKTLLDLDLVKYDRPIQYILLLNSILLFAIYMQRVNGKNEILMAVLLTAIINILFLTFGSAFWVIENGLVFSNGTDFFRLTGIFSSPIESAVFLVLGLIVVIEHVTNKKLKVLLLVIFSVLILLSFSRAAYVGALMVITLGIFKIFKSKNTFLKIVKIFTIVLSIYLIFQIEAFNIRLLDLANINFNIKRVMVWNHVINTWMNSGHELWIGFPLGSYLFFHPIDQANYNNTHNSYLDLLYYFGMIGLTVLCVLFALVLIRIKVLRRHFPNELSLYVSFFLVLAAINMVDTVYLGITLYLLHGFFIADTLHKRGIVNNG
ncbi:hypothetical protein OAI29_08670 [Amylibacter sp.]|nr:hypothetical protein [Amylibacter sp.]